MSFNPFNERPQNTVPAFLNWKDMTPKPYNKFTVDPYTRIRCILANGGEYEAVWFSHQFNRHCDDNDLRRELAVLRRQEQQQQKQIANLKPINEGVLELTIGYEQLAVELTAMFAKNESDKYVKQALDFALLEDFDHLYRFADLLEMDKGVLAEKIVGELTEIMPARPTIAEHRHPYDDIKRFCNFKQADISTALHVNIITAAEQQTMNYYNNSGSFYQNKLGRQLFGEIAMIEEQHVSMYGGLKDVNCTWLEELLMHEYSECYLYYSLMQYETDKYINKIWEQNFDMELQHLQKAVELLEKYENKHWQQVIKKGEFPELIQFDNSVDYIRDVIKNTTTLTGKEEDYAEVDSLDNNDNFFFYQNTVNVKENNVPSHNVIEKYIADNGQDYRFEVDEHPLENLQDRKKDNIHIGR